MAIHEQRVAAFGMDRQPSANVQNYPECLVEKEANNSMSEGAQSSVEGIVFQGSTIHTHISNDGSTRPSDVFAYFISNISGGQ